MRDTPVAIECDADPIDGRTVDVLTVERIRAYGRNRYDLELKMGGRCAILRFDNARKLERLLASKSRAAGWADK